MLIQKSCPVCNSNKGRNISGSLRYCSFCDIVYNISYTPLSYDDSYFLDEYKDQYGRTYLQDFDSIYNQSRKRLARILNLFRHHDHTQGLSLLDIGSAMGFFLKAAHDCGIEDLLGIEISQYASQYCQNEYDIPVIHGAYEQRLLSRIFDIITAWFFIEHCEDPIRVLRELYSYINTPGILAFSVPSIFGPLYTCNRPQWVASHPADHRIDFSPSSLRKILHDIGFNKIIIKPSGFHPERIINPDSVLHRPFASLYRVFSKLTSFSDTLEVYALKEI